MLTKNQIKLIRSLSLKKNRQKHGLFIVEGEKLVNEVLSSDWEVEGIYATKTDLFSLKKKQVLKMLLLQDLVK